MKKILSGLLVVMFCSLSANATTFVKYNNAGSPSTYNGFGQKINTNNFGSNAKFTPQARAAEKARQRALKHEDQYYNGLEKGNAININIIKPSDNQDTDSDCDTQKDNTSKTKKNTNK